MQCIIMENTLIKLTLHDETKKKAHKSQIVRAKENLKLSHGTLIFTVDNYILLKKINVYLGLSQLQSSILLVNTISLYHIVKCLLSYYIIQQFRKKLFCLLSKQV